jgi:GNAT superfamily N-acetyltransferase
MNCAVVEATEDEVRSGVIGRSLREFNYGVIGEYPKERPIRLNAKNTDGELLGGLRAIVSIHWLIVEVLWVAEGSRGHGVGRALLRECESRALALGAHSAWLQTFDWQAPAFYARQGYVECARMRYYVQGHDLITLEKRGLCERRSA